MNIPALHGAKGEASAELNIDLYELCFYRTYTTHLNENKNCPENRSSLFKICSLFNYLTHHAGSCESCV